MPARLSSDLNRLVMDYLVLEGYQAAAEEFSKEANVSPPVDFSSIETRMTIREAVQRGDVEEAIELVNDLNPEVRTTLPSRPLLWEKDTQLMAGYLNCPALARHSQRSSLSPCMDLTALLRSPNMHLC